MIAIYVTSSVKGAGKTTLCAGLGKKFLGSGKKVGFFKPVLTGSQNPNMAGIQSDAEFMKRLFGLTDSVDRLCPVYSDENSLSSRVKLAYDQIAAGKDIVLIEGVDGSGQISREVAAKLDARVMAVVDYSQEPAKSVTGYKDFGSSLLGVVVNKVPQNQKERLLDELCTLLGSEVTILGMLPEERTLLALDVNELAGAIQGELVADAAPVAGLVENVMLGALAVDPGPLYFGRKANKAVVLKSERPDMQMAALQTSVTCLVLTGSTPPKSFILEMAREKKVPIILTKGDVATTVTKIEDILGKTGFNPESKLPRLNEILGQHFSFPTFYQKLGLAS
ncbi:MAG: DRTGG domain-containing protein [Chloroflexota bacterium]